MRLNLLQTPVECQKLESVFFVFILTAKKSISNITEFNYFEWQSAVTETHQTIEKISGILLFCFFKMVPAMAILLMFIYSFFVYFTTDLKRDAFQFHFPMW